MAYKSDLSGCRIWLSGSIPDDLTEAEWARMKEFVQELARTVFLKGGSLIHGFHPTLTPALLEIAGSYRSKSDRRAPLTLAVSTSFRDPATSGYGGLSVAENAQVLKAISTMILRIMRSLLR